MKTYASEIPRQHAYLCTECFNYHTLEKETMGIKINREEKREADTLLIK